MINESVGTKHYVLIKTWQIILQILCVAAYFLNVGIAVLENIFYRVWFAEIKFASIQIEKKLSYQVALADNVVINSL